MGDEYDDVLAELRREFVTTQLKSRIDSMAVLVANAGASDAARDEARRAAHMLHGTSGSYGLGALSEALAPLEAIFGSPLDAAGLARAQALFQEARALATAALRAEGV